MSKAAKIWLITAASLVLLGIVIFVGAMIFLKWDFKKLSTSECEINEHEITDSFESIAINTDTSDIELLPSEDGSVKVICHEEANLKHSVEINDGRLEITLVNTRKWYEHISFFSPDTSITVYIPEEARHSLSVDFSTGDIDVAKELCFESIDISGSTGKKNIYASVNEKLKIESDTGDVCLDGVSASEIEVITTTGDIKASDTVCEGNFTVNVSTGDTSLTDVTCESLITEGDTGDISLKNVIAKNKFSIDRDTGNVILEDADASEIYVKTSTGDVKGTLLSEKIFFVDTSTGKIDTPKSMTGGRCEITTSTGDVVIKYSADVE